jgi:hypothetical protein
MFVVLESIPISRANYKQNYSGSGNPHSSSRNSLSETQGEKSDGWFALEPSDFSPGASERDLLELECGFPEPELLLIITCPAAIQMEAL